MDIDVLKRARLYSEAIKRHDVEIEKKKLDLGNFNSFILKHLIHIGNSDPPIIESHLLIDVGLHAVEILNLSEKEILNSEEFLWLSKGASLFNDAFRLGAQIECKEELIAYMSLDD